MARSYSPKLLDRVQESSVYKLGTDLAGACIKANLPAVYVAQVFNTTRMTIHTWFRGGAIRYKKRERIERFIMLIEEDIERGLLPCKNLREARDYLRGIVGKPIKVLGQKEQS